MAQSTLIGRKIVMEEKLNLYKVFSKFAFNYSVDKGLTATKAKKILKLQLDNHPFGMELIPYVDGLKIEQSENLSSLFENCIRLCDELGASRDYITLVMILESMANASKDEENADELIDFLEQFKIEIADINHKIPEPPVFNMIMESRSLLEWASIYAIYPFIPKRIEGKGKPVLLIPPYLGDDYSTSFVRKYLKSLGFYTYRWDMGFNMVKSHYIPRLEEKLDDIYQKHNEKVSIVGWSGGGIFAKIMANRHPNQVEQIITIGSPIWGVMDMKTPVYGLLEFFRGKSLKERNARFLAELEPIPDVPITCIYTKTDGLVPWKHCMEAESYRKNIKNIEVYGSHSGLGANASVLMLTANALSANLQGLEIEDVTTNIERVLYPYYWNGKKKAFKNRNELLKT